MSGVADVPATLPALFDQAATAYAGRCAIAGRDGEIAYAALAEAVRATAAGLVAAGAGKGTRIAILAGNSSFWIESFLACTRIGAIAVPVSTLATPPELAHIVRHCDAHFMLAARRFVDRDYGASVAAALPTLAARSEPDRLRLPEAPFLRAIWFDDADGLAWARPIAELRDLGAADPTLDDAFLDALAAGVSPADDAVIIYTSGSTAQPKAVLHAHGPMARQIRVLADAQLGETSPRLLCLLPMFWVGGMTILLELFLRGGCIALPDGVSTRAVADAMRDIHVDIVHGWPAQIKPLRELLETSGFDFGGIRGLRDERHPDGTPKSRGEVPNSLGMTETFGPHGVLPFGTLLPADRHGAFAPASGRFERRVVDLETGQPLPPGAVGELHIRGGALTRGYYKVERAGTFTPDGFFPTQDIVRIDADGYLYLEGRTGDMLKTKGANVSRIEVEEALRRLPGVGEAVVCGLADAELGQRIVAGVVPAAGARLEPAELRGQLAGLLPGYKLPTHIAVLDRDELLWTATGKIRVADMGARLARRLALAS